MTGHDGKIFLIATLFCLVALMPLQGHARVLLKTELVSGVISKVEDNVVSLVGDDNCYYPDSKRVEMDLEPGNMVTLRYYVDLQGDHPVRKYFQYAPGKNSLPKAVPPPVDNSKK